MRNNQHIPKWEYLMKMYDSEASLNFELAKLGIAGWLMTGIIRWNPSPSRIQFMVWFAREMITDKTTKGPKNISIGDGIKRVQGDPLGPPCDWPTFNPESNPFDFDSDDYIPGLDDIKD